MEQSFDSKRRLDLSDYSNRDSVQDSPKTMTSRDYEEKLEQMKQLYEQRIESITAFAHKFYEIAQSDDVLLTMQGNSVSEKFANHRLRELFEEVMIKECEVTINNLQSEVSSQKLLVSKLEQEKMRLQGYTKTAEDNTKAQEMENKRLEREIYEHKNRIASMRTEFEDALKRRDREISSKYDDLRSSFYKDEQGKKDKAQQEIENLRFMLEKERSRNKTLEDETKKLKRQVNDSRVHEEASGLYEQAREENSVLQDKYQRLEDSHEKLQKQAQNFEKQLKTILSAEQKASNEALSTLQQKYKSRSKMFKRKILDQKQTIESLDQQLKSYKQGIEDYKKNIDKKAIGNQEDLKRVKDEWERKCNEVIIEYQRKEAELQTKQQIQLVSLQNQYQKLLEDRVQEIQREMAQSRAKNREVEIRAALEEKIKDYVSRIEYEELVKEKEKLLKTCEKFTSQTAAFEKEFEKVVKERALLEKVLENEREKAREIEENNEEKKKRQQMEEKVQILNNSLSQYRSLIVEKENEIEELSKKNKELRTSLASASIDLESEQMKNTTMKRDLQGLKSELELTENNKRELENQMIIAQSQLEIENRRKKAQNTEKYEEETAKHIETKTRLIQVEGKLTQLTRENEEHIKKLKEMKETIKNNDIETSKLKKKILEYDSEINIERISSCELQKKVDKLLKGNYLKIEVISKVKSKIQNMRNSLRGFKSFVVELIQEVKKDNSSSIQDLLFRFLDSNNYMRKQLEIRYQTINDEMNEEWIKKIQSVEENVSKHANMSTLQYQEKLQSQEKIIDALKGSLQAVKKEQKLSLDEIDKYKKRISELQEKLNVMEKDNKNLENSLKKNSDAFDTLQEEIKKEVVKMQNSHENALEKLKKELDKKHSTEMNEFLEKYKSKDTQGEVFLREKLKEIEHLKEEEIYQTKKKYQELLDKAYNEAQTEREKSSRMKQKLSQIEEEIAMLKQDHIKITSELEERVNFLDKHSKMEIEVLHSQLQHVETKDTKFTQLEMDLSEKSDEIQTLRKDREKIRNRLKELEEKIEVQTKNFYNQLSMKDKEIESLRSVVSRSYTDSLDRVKMARELDKETQELTKQARKGVSARSPGYSYSSEISKPT